MGRLWNLSYFPIRLPARHAIAPSGSSPCPATMSLLAFLAPSLPSQHPPQQHPAPQMPPAQPLGV